MAMSSLDFSDQIKALEEEGSKLLAATQLLSESFQSQNGASSTDGNARSLPPSGSTSRANGSSVFNLNGLTDITAEQNTIEELKKHLDNQEKQTEVFEKEFLRGRAPVLDNAGSLLLGLDIPIGSTNSGDHDRPALPLPGMSPNSTDLMQPPRFDLALHTERPDSSLFRPGREGELGVLRAKLKEVMQVAEQQKQHSNTQIADLNTQLEQALRSKDSLLMQNRRELQNKDATVNRLQDTTTQLERANRLQEETLVDMNERLVTMQKDQSDVETSVSKLKSILYTRMGQHGKYLFDRQLTAHHSLVGLIQNLDQCFQDYDKKLMEKDEKIHALSLDIQNIKLSVGWKEEQQEKEYKQKVKDAQKYSQDQVETLEQQLKRGNEKILTLERQIEALENQLAFANKSKDEHICTLEEKLVELHKEISNEKQSFEEKEKCVKNMAMVAVAYNKSLVHKEMENIKQDNETLRSQCNGVQCLLDETRNKASSLSDEVQTLAKELTEERNLTKVLKESERAAQGDLRLLQTEVDRGREEIAELLNDMEKVKRDAEQKIQKTISVYEEEAKNHFNEEVDSMKTYLAEMREKSHQLQLDLSVNKTEYRNLQERYQETKATLERMSAEFEHANEEHMRLEENYKKKNEEIQMLQREIEVFHTQLDVKNKEMKQLEQVYQERLVLKEKEIKAVKNHQFDHLSSKDTELRRLKEHFDREIHEKGLEMKPYQELSSKLNKELQEKENALWQLQQSMKQGEDEYKELRKTIEGLATELTMYKNLAHDKELEMNRVREGHQATMTKYEEQFRQMEERCEATSKEVASVKGENELLKNDKDERVKECVELQQSVTKLQDQNNALLEQLERKQGDMGKELARVTNKLQAAEHDVAIAKKVFKSKQKFGGKVAAVAEDMQKELTEKRGQIDSLNSRIRWLEECLDSALREKEGLKAKNSQTQSAFKSGEETMEKLYDQCKASEEKVTQFKEKVAVLECALDKVTLKHSEAQTTIERQAQDMARMELQHSLHVKEMSRLTDTHKQLLSDKTGQYMPVLPHYTLSKVHLKTSGNTFTSSGLANGNVNAVTARTRVTQSNQGRQKPPVQRHQMKMDDVPTKDVGESSGPSAVLVHKSALAEGKVPAQPGCSHPVSELVLRGSATPPHQAESSNVNEPAESLLGSSMFSQLLEHNPLFARPLPDSRYAPIAKDFEQFHNLFMRDRSAQYSPQDPLGGYTSPGARGSPVSSENNEYKWRNTYLNHSGENPEQGAVSAYQVGKGRQESVPRHDYLPVLHHPDATLSQQVPMGMPPVHAGNGRHDQAGKVSASTPYQDDYHLQNEQRQFYSDALDLGGKQHNQSAPPTASTQEGPSNVFTHSSNGAFRSVSKTADEANQTRERKENGRGMNLASIENTSCNAVNSRNEEAPSTSKHVDILVVSHDTLPEASEDGVSLPKSIKFPFKDMDENISPKFGKCLKIPLKQKVTLNADSLTDTKPRHSKDVSNPSSAIEGIRRSRKVKPSGDKCAKNTSVNNKLASRSRVTQPESKPTSQQDLCKRLEEKLESLNKLGDQLQSDNESLAHQMHQDGKKLADLKAQIKS